MKETYMKPMLPNIIKDLNKVKLPVYISPVFTGVRAYREDGKLFLEDGQEVKNRFVQESLKELPDLLDGFIIIKIDKRVGTYEETLEELDSQDTTPDFLFIVFDVCIKGVYLDRYQVLHDTVELYKNSRVKMLSTSLIDSKDELFAIEAAYTRAGYKGLFIRSIKSKYKQGTPTVRQGWLLKFSREQNETPIS
jgi:hypothetical protein